MQSFKKGMFMQRMKNALVAKLQNAQDNKNK